MKCRHNKLLLENNFTQIWILQYKFPELKVIKLKLKLATFYTFFLSFLI